MAKRSVTNRNSMAARLVARDIINEVVNGRIPNKEQIQLKRGYAPTSARHGKAVQTASYKDEINTFLAKLTKHQNDVLTAMMNKNLKKEKYKTLSDSLAKITHDTQLLSGGETERNTGGLDSVRTQINILIQEARGTNPNTTKDVSATS